MLAALILVVSFVALVQFAIWYWRGVMATVAAQPLSDRARNLLIPGGSPPSADDFDVACVFYELCPELELGAASPSTRTGDRLGGVRAYYHLVSVLRTTSRALLPALSRWAAHEMETCSRYAAVVVGQRIERNAQAIAHIHSY